MTTKTRVMIVGPNFEEATSLEQFTVHEAECPDIPMGHRLLAQWLARAFDDRFGVASFICGLTDRRFYKGPDDDLNQLTEHLWASLDEIHFAPCLKDLQPYVSGSESDVDLMKRVKKRLKKRTLTDLTPEERATYDAYIARLATADKQVNQSDFGPMYADAVAANDALQGEFENWAAEIGLPQEEL